MRGLALNVFLLFSLALAPACSPSPAVAPACTGACTCVSSTDCGAGQSCLAGYCAPAQTCSVDGDCSDPTQICTSGSCVIGSRGPDAGDAGRPDAGPHDGGLGDGGSPDSGAAPDGGSLDSGFDDAGSADAGSYDAGFNDAGAADSGQTASGDAGDAGPGDAGTVDSGLDAGVAADAGGCATAADCPAFELCLHGVCGPCTADSQCGPPAAICQSGVCSSGCLPGGCPSGQLCDDALTGRCVAATGSTAPGGACADGTTCQPSAESTASGLCIGLVDAGSVCSGLCEATSQCPAGMICDPLGAAGVCLSEQLLGVGGSVGTGATGAACSDYTSCDSFADFACGPFTGAGNVCTDTCAGPAMGCPAGWQCLTEALFDPDAGVSCAQDAGLCALADPNSGCFTAAQGGDDRCHGETRQDECFNLATLPSGASGQACASDANCRSNWCLAGACADPCCQSTDCPGGQACSALVGPGTTQLLACLPSSGTLAFGAACQVSQQAACRSGFCIAANPYLAPGAAGVDVGYCSDPCCSDAQCGTGFACTVLNTTLPSGGTGAAPFCVKL